MSSKSLFRHGLMVSVPWLLAVCLGGYVALDKVSDISDTTVLVGEDSEKLSPALLKVRGEYLKIEDKGDRTLIYKLFAGSAEYLKNSVVLKHTGQFDPMLGRVQTSYGWNREKYPDFTQAVSDFLVEAGYEEPRELLEESDKKWFQGIFESLVNAITTNG
tara:strand:- start:475 stop:954 length:480 start_codon:yes stop_codon:yes gene_type:complete